jgi:hypothetical protein
VPAAPLPQLGALACRATRDAFACGAFPHGRRHAPTTEQALKAGRRRARRRRRGGPLLGRQRRARRAARQGVSGPVGAPARHQAASAAEPPAGAGSAGPQGPVAWRSKVVVSAGKRARRAVRVALLGRPGACGAHCCLRPARHVSVCSHLAPLSASQSHRPPGLACALHPRAAHPTMQCHMTRPHQCAHLGVRPAGYAGAAAVDAVHARRVSQQCRPAPRASLAWVMGT